MTRGRDRNTRTRPVVGLLCALTAFGVGGNIDTVRAQTNTRVQMFGVRASRGFTALKNGSPVATVNSSGSGVLTVNVSASSGDTFRFFEAGSGAVPPSIPTGLGATGDNAGCATVSWFANPEPDILFYRLYYGTASGVHSDSVDVNGTGRVTCGLVDGTWYFAARAFNTAGLLSGLSNEVSASVSNGNAQPPLPPPLVGASAGGDGCADVLWIPVGDPNVVAYEVSYGRESVAQGQASQYEFSVDAGTATTTRLCNLTSGNWYIAVRSRNYLGMLSAFSTERAVTIVSTPVLITAFDARPENFGVAIEWRIDADEQIDGIRVLRQREQSGEAPVPVHPGGLMSPGEVRIVDLHVEGNTRYLYTLEVLATSGATIVSPAVSVLTNPLELFLEQNYPNPFNPATTISFILAEPGAVVLTVHDVRGRLVTTLVREARQAGRSVVAWEGLDMAGRRVASGHYFYRLATPSGVRTRKMLLLK